MKQILLILIAFTVLACEKAEEPEIYDNKLIGYWNNPVYTDSILEYTRTTCLKENEIGMQFLEQGKLYERNNSGWCGTPPISCTDYKGSWEQNDSLIDITVGYWGGQMDYEWHVLSLDNYKLQVKILNTALHEF